MLLGVATVLEGSVRRSGNRLRVTAQLIAAADGSHLWSERYDRELTDVFEIQDYIAASIADALKIKLAPAERPRYTPLLPAFEALLQGRHAMFRQTAGSGLQAKAHYERAIALDPRYADPHASLGLSYFTNSLVGGEPLRETASAIRTEVHRALALDPADLAPHFLLGRSRLRTTTIGRPRVTLRVLDSRPAMCWPKPTGRTRSLYLQPLGRLDEAARHMERAVERDPLNAHWRGVFVNHPAHAGQFDRAILEAEEALRIDSTQFAAYSTLGETYVILERWSDAYLR